MANSYFSGFTDLVRRTIGRSETVNALFDLVVTGFDKLPAPAAVDGEGFSVPVEVGDAATRADAVNFGQIQDGLNLYTDTGTANAKVITPSPAWPSLTAPKFYKFVNLTLNTGPTTIDVGGTGPVAMVYPDGTAFVGGELPAGHVGIVYYNGTNNRLLNPAITPSGPTAPLDYKYKASASDTTQGYGNDKISVSGTQVTKSISSPGGNETVNIAVKASAASKIYAHQNLR